MEGLEAAKTIERYIRPDTFPLGFRVLKDGEPVPDKARRPGAMGFRVSICQGVSMARRYGWTVAMGGSDLSCPIAEVAFGFKPEVPYYREGHLASGMYVQDLALGARTEAEVPKTPPSEAGTVLVAPLAKDAFDPEVVCVYGNSAQVMCMVAAALFHGGEAITSRFSARADCADIVNRTRQTGKPQVILPCYGDRVFGQTQDHEMAFTLPASDLERFVEGLEGCHRGGVRYPVPHYLRYQAEFPASYEKLWSLWDEGGEGEPT